MKKVFQEKTPGCQRYIYGAKAHVDTEQNEVAMIEVANTIVNPCWSDG